MSGKHFLPLHTPRLRFAAYTLDGSGLLCSYCAVQTRGFSAVWRAVHGLSCDPPMSATPIGLILADAPLAPCTGCGKLFWEIIS